MKNYDVCKNVSVIYKIIIISYLKICNYKILKIMKYDENIQNIHIF